MDWFFLHLFFGLPILLPGPGPTDPDPDSPEKADRESTGKLEADQ
jgi:hypothetical protein